MQNWEDKFELTSHNICEQKFEYRGPKACNRVPIPFLDQIFSWVQQCLGICIMFFGFSVTFFGEKILILILRVLVTLIISWQMFQFIYNVLLPSHSEWYFATLALLGSIGVGFVVGERVNILRENRKAMMIGIFAWIGSIIGTIFVGAFSIESIPMAYIIYVGFILALGFLASKIQYNAQMRDGQKMATTTFIGATLATHGLRKVFETYELDFYIEDTANAIDENDPINVLQLPTQMEDKEVLVLGFFFIVLMVVGMIVQKYLIYGEQEEDYDNEDDDFKSFE